MIWSSLFRIQVQGCGLRCHPRLLCRKTPLASMPLARAPRGGSQARPNCPKRRTEQNSAARERQRLRVRTVSYEDAREIVWRLMEAGFPAAAIAISSAGEAQEVVLHTNPANRARAKRAVYGQTFTLCKLYPETSGKSCSISRAATNLPERACNAPFCRNSICGLRNRCSKQARALSADGAWRDRIANASSFSARAAGCASLAPFSAASVARACEIGLCADRVPGDLDIPLSNRGMWRLQARPKMP
jgi:hypothetical protein